jgi:hypothetical protein
MANDVNDEENRGNDNTERCSHLVATSCLLPPRSFNHHQIRRRKKDKRDSQQVMENIINSKSSNQQQRIIIESTMYMPYFANYVQCSASQQYYFGLIFNKG